MDKLERCMMGRCARGKLDSRIGELAWVDDRCVIKAVKSCYTLNMSTPLHPQGLEQQLRRVRGSLSCGMMNRWVEGLDGCDGVE